MTDMRVVIDDSSVEVSPKGTVTGRICFAFKAAAFPDEAWNDYILVILGWWLEALAGLCSLGTNEAEFHFMDGPFSVRLLRREKEEIVMKFVGRRSQHGSEEMVVRESDLVRQLSEVARRVLKLCEGTPASASDVASLRAALERVGSAQKS